jgi:hypothetical protein
MSDLPETAQTLLIELRGQGETAYRAIADTSIALIDSGGYPAMGVYETVAGLVGLCPRTVRDYCDTVRTVGDLLDEFAMFCREHWRAMIPVARKHLGGDKDPQAVRDELAKIAGEWLETSERFGGVIVPPSVMFAREKVEPTPDEQLAAAIGATASAHDRLVKAVNAGAHHSARFADLLDAAGDAIGALVDAADEDAMPDALRPERDGACEDGDGAGEWLEAAA